MNDDKTAVTIDNDATAITDSTAKDGLKKPAVAAPAKKNSSFSFFGASVGSNNPGTKLKYTRNVIDEAAVEDDPVMGRERAKYGHEPIIKTVKKRETKKVLIISAIIAVLLVTIVIGGIKYMSSPVREDRLLSLGDKYLTELDYENAILAFEAALRLNAENKSAYIGLIKSYLGLKRYDKASEIADAAIAIFGRIDELVELRRRVFVASIGKDGLYLDTGKYVSPNDRLSIDDIKDAFLYYGSERSVLLAGTVKDSSTEQVNAAKLTKTTIEPDTIYPLDGNTYIEDLVLSHIEGKGQDNCWIVLQIYKDSNSTTYEEDRYQVVSQQYIETAKESNVSEDNNVLIHDEDAEDTSSDTEETTLESEQKSTDVGLYLTNGTKVSNLGEISLSDLKGAVFNVGKDDAYFAADIYIEPYYMAEDPYEPDWAYMGPYKSGASISMSDYVDDFNAYPDYNYLWVTIKNYNDYQNGNYSPGQEFNYRIIR